MLTTEDLSQIKSLINESSKETQHFMNILIEGKVIPQIQILAEGHQMLLETLAPKDRVERLEDEVDFLKSVVKALSQEVKELKAG